MSSNNMSCQRTFNSIAKMLMKGPHILPRCLYIIKANFIAMLLRIHLNGTKLSLPDAKQNKTKIKQ
jgi:hypothetical protein